MDNDLLVAHGSRISSDNRRASLGNVHGSLILAMVVFSDVKMIIGDEEFGENSSKSTKSTSEIVSTLQGQKRLEGMKSLASQRKLQLERSNSVSTRQKRFSPAKSKTMKLNQARSAFAEASGAKWSDTVALIKARESAKRYVIDPRTSRFIGKWDLVAALALCYTAVITPYEVSFLPATTLAGPWSLFVSNRIVDLIFLMDLL